MPKPVRATLKGKARMRNEMGPKRRLSYVWPHMAQEVRGGAFEILTLELLQ